MNVERGFETLDQRASQLENDNYSNIIDGARDPQRGEYQRTADQLRVFREALPMIRAAFSPEGFTLANGEVIFASRYRKKVLSADPVANPARDVELGTYQPSSEASLQPSKPADLSSVAADVERGIYSGPETPLQPTNSSLGQSKAASFGRGIREAELGSGN